MQPQRTALFQVFEEPADHLARGAEFSGDLAVGGTEPAVVLRGVRLQGIDSVMAPVPLRKLAWERLASELDLGLLHSMTTEVALSDLLNVAPKILAGQIRGRSIVNTHA